MVLWDDAQGEHAVLRQARQHPQHLDPAQREQAAMHAFQDQVDIRDGNGKTDRLCLAGLRRTAPPWDG